MGDRKQWLTYEFEGGPLDPNTVFTKDRLHQHEATRWALNRDQESVAVLDNFGWLEIGGRRIDLHARYRELDGRIYPLVLEAFDRLLP